MRIAIAVSIAVTLLVSFASPASAFEQQSSHAGCNTYKCIKRVAHKQHARTIKRWKKVVAPLDSYLMRIATCESGLRWHLASGNGFFGGLQFTAKSWWAVGGKGYAHQASPLEQKFRAVLLSHLQGWGAWPVCRYR